MDQSSRAAAAVEKQTLLKLYQEQETVLWAHRVPMKPATIRFVDSATFWGRWDAETRTISIARRLVSEYSWYCARSILRHEMAHQYANEVLRSPSHLHDERFAECCRKLGVPDEFARASASLQEHALDWKDQKQEEGVEKLLSKVRKLLALATSSNEHEALLAMKKVREVYARHNLEEIEAQSPLADRTRMVHLLISHKKKRIEAHQAKICGILVGQFFVKVIFCKEFDPATGDEHQAMQLIGTRENVLMAEYVYHFLLSQTESLLRDLKRRHGTLSRVQAKSYRLGILDGFQEKLERESIFEDESQTTPPARALALTKLDQRLENYVSQVYPRLASRSTGRQFVDPSVYQAGEAAGARITLHRGVSDRGGNSGKLLT